MDCTNVESYIVSLVFQLPQGGHRTEDKFGGFKSGPPVEHLPCLSSAKAAPRKGSTVGVEIDYTDEARGPSLQHW